MHTLTSATDRTLERRRIRIPQVRLVEERASTEAMRCDAFRVDVVWLGRVRGACERGDGRHSGAALKCRRVHSACTSGRSTTSGCGSAFNAPDDRRFEHERSGATRGHQCGDCIGHAARVLRPTDGHTRALIECQRRLLRARRVRGPLSRTNRRNTIERHGPHHVILARVGSAVLKERTHERLPREGLLDVLKSALAESVHERRILLRRPPLIGVHAHGKRPPRGAKKRLRSADRRSRGLAIPASISGAQPTPYLELETIVALRHSRLDSISRLLSRAHSGKQSSGAHSCRLAWCPPRRAGRCRHGKRRCDKLRNAQAARLSERREQRSLEAKPHARIELLWTHSELSAQPRVQTTVQQGNTSRQAQIAPGPATAAQRCAERQGLRLHRVDVLTGGVQSLERRDITDAARAALELDLQKNSCAHAALRPGGEVLRGRYNIPLALSPCDRKPRRGRGCKAHAKSSCEHSRSSTCGEGCARQPERNRAAAHRRTYGTLELRVQQTIGFPVDDHLHHTVSLAPPQVDQCAREVGACGRHRV